MRVIRHWIGGKTFERASERHGDVFDPATGAVAGHVAFASVEEVDLAVAAAHEAWKSWRFSSLAKRSRVLFAFRELVEKHKKEIAALLTSEHGKVPSDALGEVAR